MEFSSKLLRLEFYCRQEQVVTDHWTRPPTLRKLPRYTLALRFRRKWFVRFTVGKWVVDGFETARE